jgi:hypothetical protein
MNCWGEVAEGKGKMQLREEITGKRIFKGLAEK